MTTKPGKEKTAINDPELKRRLDYIENLSHYEMVVLWRFSRSGHPFFEEGAPETNAFVKRLEELGGITPEISKKVGCELGSNQKAVLEKTAALWHQPVVWGHSEEER